MLDTAAHERTVRIADFPLPLGAVPIERLMAMSREDWEELRQSINVGWQKDGSIVAKCRLCEGRVFIRAQAVDSGHLPLFRHAHGAPEDCPWYTGTTLIPDDARAAQYDGQQESAEHRQLCHLIEELAKRDSRCADSAVEKYLRPAVHKRGRFPDVYLDMSDLGRFVIEVQLSKPFAPEIVARHLHYEREGVAILWVFTNLDEPLPQGFHDVITMQRGNAFLFDDEARDASFNAGTLVLKCYLEDGEGGYRAPRLVKLDDLETKTGRSVFLEDCRTERLLTSSREVRAVWWKALMAARRERPEMPFRASSFDHAYEVMCKRADLYDWQLELWMNEAERGQHHLAQLFAIFTSIAHSAEEGIHVVYTTRYTGAGALLAMLNSKVGSASFAAYADLVAVFLDATPLRYLLERASLQDTLKNARRAHPQIGPDHPIWKAMELLFPEVLDGLVRRSLMELGSLPVWASPETPS